jgi:energy-coupling factor transporter ATP-binding protein EcfA2
MEKKFYTARKILPAGRNGWVIEFRHPLVKDDRGKPGRKIRRGLGTNISEKANELVQQMNVLLSSEEYWSSAGKLNASASFDEGIVNAFYDEIEYLVQNYKQKRDELIPLKSKKDNYTQVLLLGSTGAGKTTLLRQLMGTNPETEKFPATSTAKTTVFDTEIIFAEGEYSGVVTFYSESETREFVKESIKNSILEYLITKDKNQTLRVFLEDKEQRFRLGYTIGKIKEKKKFSKYENLENIAGEIDSIKGEEQEALENNINGYLNDIINISQKVSIQCNQEYAANASLTDEDKTILEEIISYKVSDYDEDDFHELTDKIVEDIKIRFAGLDQQTLTTEKFGWPIYWSLKTTDRNEFLSSIRFFSSNTSGMFGRLLTPLVSGMRVQGPFKPSFLTDVPNLTIIDGEGLGHIPDTTSNLPSSTISKFDTSDAIILVDNAQNPMMAPPYAVIKSLAISGHYPKLFVCFTHFDSVKGDNLPTINDKIDHVYGAADNLLGKLESELEYDVKRFLSNHLHDHSYYLSNLDQSLGEDALSLFTSDQLIDLTAKLNRMISPTVVTEAIPVYDITTIIIKIQNAAKQFHNIWDGYLYGSNVSLKRKAHFTQIKALSLRLGYGSQYEYSFLTPISDFWASFNGQISGFLSTPVKWEPFEPTEEDKLKKIDEFKKIISSKIQDYAKNAMKEEMLDEWQNAYSQYSGKGSASERAKRIGLIYSKSVPIPEDETPLIVQSFIKNIIIIITETITDEQKGKVVSAFDKV